MKFKFELGTVLKVRRHHETNQKKVFGDAMRAVMNVEEEIAQRLRDMDIFSKQENPVSATPGAIEMRYAYLHGLHKQRFDLEKDLKKAREEAEKQRLKLVELHRKTKILENLEAKKKVAFVQEENRLEMLELNEIATIRFNRSRS